MTETAVIPAAETAAAIMERVVIAGDLAKLTEAERVTYYFRVCESLGLNPLTRPFDYITLNGKLTLYPNKDAAAQLRKTQRVSITDLRTELIGDVYTVVVAGTANGRSDFATGAVNIKGLAGEGLANAYMKAETKAKRRLSLSLAGLGFADESEVEDMPAVIEPPVPKSLAERAADKAAAIAAVERVESAEVTVLASPMTPEASAMYSNAEEIAGGAVAVLAPPAAKDGLSAHDLIALATAAKRTKAQLAAAIGCEVGAIVDRLGAMTDLERGVLADELNLDWRV